MQTSDTQNCQIGGTSLQLKDRNTQSQHDFNILYPNMRESAYIIFDICCSQKRTFFLIPFETRSYKRPESDNSNKSNMADDNTNVFSGAEDTCSPESDCLRTTELDWSINNWNRMRVKQIGDCITSDLFHTLSGCIWTLVLYPLGRRGNAQSSPFRSVLNSSTRFNRETNTKMQDFLNRNLTVISNNLAQ